MDTTDSDLSFFDKIPDEVLHIFLNFLKYQDIANFRLLCFRINIACSDYVYWNTRIKRELSPLTMPELQAVPMEADAPLPEQVELVPMETTGLLLPKNITPVIWYMKVMYTITTLSKYGKEPPRLPRDPLMEVDMLLDEKVGKWNTVPSTRISTADSGTSQSFDSQDFNSNLDLTTNLQLFNPLMFPYEITKNLSNQQTSNYKHQGGIYNIVHHIAIRHEYQTFYSISHRNRPPAKTIWDVNFVSGEDTIETIVTRQMSNGYHNLREILQSLFPDKDGAKYNKWIDDMIQIGLMKIVDH